MDPAVVAAIIAAVVSFLTLIVSVWAQNHGVNKSSADNTKTLEAQREQLQGAFEAQSKQLKSTLEAQSEQLKSTLVQERDRTFNERFATAAGQLGDDKPAAVRLAGVYAMAGLADDWPGNRQTCIDVLCAYLRMPYKPHPGYEAAEAERLLAFRASREVRHTVIRVIAAHLRDDAEDDEPPSWHGLNFDFTGVAFDGGDFRRARFSRGTVDFAAARFSGGRVYFRHARFSGGTVGFRRARFSGATVDFVSARFSGGRVDFGGAQFSGGRVDFGGAQFSGGTVDFAGAQFSGGTVDFAGAQFSGGTVDFSNADSWSSKPAFPWTGTPPPGVKLPKKEVQSQE